MVAELFDDGGSSSMFTPPVKCLSTSKLAGVETLSGTSAPSVLRINNILF